MIRRKNVMIRRTDLENRHAIAARAAAVILAAVLCVLPSAGFAYAASETDSTEPVRAVHKVRIEDKSYCFFVQKNVIFTPAEIAAIVAEVTKTEENSADSQSQSGIEGQDQGTDGSSADGQSQSGTDGQSSDSGQTADQDSSDTSDKNSEAENADAEKINEALTDEIISRSGLYVKEANCTKASHKAVKAADWENKNREFALSDASLSAILNATPSDGAPVKVHMDLNISVKSSDDKQSVLYSTFWPTSDELLMVVVATDSDAAKTADICKEKAAKVKTPSTKAIMDGAEEVEMLPEFRTITMTDRSGPPIEDTLKDGDPVTLEWKEPKKFDTNGEEKSWLERFPGGIIGLVALAAAAVAVPLVIIIRRRKEAEDE